MEAAFAIAAHDEASAIVPTVRHLAALGAPVYVIADHCADDTARLAAEAGARVYERREGPGGKGAALAWFVEAAWCELEEYRCLIVLDADSRLGDGFVAAMAERFAQGAVAAQGFVCPVGAEQSPASALAAYSELLSQEIGDKIRARLGWTVHLRGKGMAFRPSVLREMAAHLRTRTEDIEMSLWLARRRIRVHFVPRALIYDPEPANAYRASRQRARWLHGLLQVWWYYWREILCVALAGGPSAWSLLWAVLARPKTLVSAVKVVLFVPLGLLAFSAVGSAWLRFLPVGLLCLSLAVDLTYYLVGLFLVPDRGLYARAMLAAPLYLVIWLRSLVLVGVSKETWLRARD